jgi:hypothetical protein
MEKEAEKFDEERQKHLHDARYLQVRSPRE